MSILLFAIFFLFFSEKTLVIVVPILYAYSELHIAFLKFLFLPNFYKLFIGISASVTGVIRMVSGVDDRLAALENDLNVLNAKVSLLQTIVQDSANEDSATTPPEVVNSK